MVAVGVAKYDLTELQSIADDDRKILTAQSYGGLGEIVQSLQSVIEVASGISLEGTSMHYKRVWHQLGCYKLFSVSRQVDPQTQQTNFFKVKEGFHYTLPR